MVKLCTSTACAGRHIALTILVLQEVSRGSRAPVNDNGVVLFNFDSFQLPENGANQFRRVSTQLEVQTRISCQGEAVDSVHVLVGW